MRDFPVVFHFRVEFDQISSTGESDHDVRFQEVTGMGAEITTEEVREGGVNDYIHRIPTGTKYGNLVLKRGYIASSSVTEWCRNTLENFEFEPKDTTVMLLNDQHDPVASWRFSRAYPVKWSVSDFKATENALVIESMELAYSNFRKV